MKKVAVVLAGCGFRDGSEITEAVSALIGLSEEGLAYQCFAPSQPFEVVNNITGESSGEKRDVLTEAARIARGGVIDLKDLKAEQYDALLFPGGFGAALNLCDWAKKGAQSSVLPAVTSVITAFHNQGKPIGAICIAPVLLAKTLGGKNITLTIGDDKETAQEISKTGARHQDCKVTDCVVDKKHKVVTTPAYMYDARPHEVFQGVRRLVTELKTLMQ